MIYQFPVKVRPELAELNGTAERDEYLRLMGWFIEQGRLNDAKRLFNYGCSEGFPPVLDVPEDVLCLLEEATEAGAAKAAGRW